MICPASLTHRTLQTKGPILSTLPGLMQLGQWGMRCILLGRGSQGGGIFQVRECWSPHVGAALQLHWG